MTRVLTLIEWVEPDTVTKHQPGEIADIDPVKVPDLMDLVNGRSVELLPALVVPSGKKQKDGDQ